MDGEDVILIFNQYASKGDGHTIHSCSQLRHFGSVVDDVPRAVGRHQRIITPCGKHIPFLAVKDGLCHMVLSNPTRSDLVKLPKITMTSDVPWDPRILDTDPFDEFEETREAQQEFHLDPDFDDEDVDHEVMVEYCVCHAFEALVKRHVPRYDNLRPYLGYIPVERVKKTFENTTQWYRASTHLPFAIISSRVFLQLMSDVLMKWLPPTRFFLTFLLLMTVCSIMAVSRWFRFMSVATVYY